MDTEMAIVATSTLYGTDFWDMEVQMLHTADNYMQDSAKDLVYVINTSVKVDSGEIEFNRGSCKEVVYRRPTIEMKLLMFDSEQSKAVYLSHVINGDKARYK